jgi:hypothetical protein
VKTVVAIDSSVILFNIRTDGLGLGAFREYRERATVMKNLHSRGKSRRTRHGFISQQVPNRDVTPHSRIPLRVNSRQLRNLGYFKRRLVVADGRWLK